MDKPVTPHGQSTQVPTEPGAVVNTPTEGGPTVSTGAKQATVEKSIPTRVFDDLFWPAAAGNVAWALFTLVLAPGGAGEPWARGAMLFFLGVYLVLSWLRSRDSGHTPLPLAFDAMHLITVALLAIALSQPTSGPERLRWLLTFVLLVTTVGHAFTVWDPPASQSALRDDAFKWKMRKRRSALSLPGVVGIATAWLAWSDQRPLLRMAVAMLLALVVWWLVRYRVIPRNEWEVAVNER
jgi:hypothetical protein